MNYEAFYKGMNKIAELYDDAKLTNMIAMAESGADPKHKENYYWGRTAARYSSTNKDKYPSSSAWGPMQITKARAQDMAKRYPAFGSLYNTKLDAMYNKMLRTGKSREEIAAVRKNPPADYDPTYDYGGVPNIGLTDVEKKVYMDAGRAEISRLRAAALKRHPNDADAALGYVTNAWHYGDSFYKSPADVQRARQKEADAYKARVLANADKLR